MIMAVLLHKYFCLAGAGNKNLYRMLCELKFVGAVEIRWKFRKFANKWGGYL